MLARRTLKTFSTTATKITLKDNRKMELYYHKTDGGAEYYQADPTDIQTAVLRTDGAELEIMSLEQLKKVGFKSVVFNGVKYDL